MYYKILTIDYTHHNYTYKLGRNEMLNRADFNNKECENGLHFCTINDLGNWHDYGVNVAYVSIPDDAKVVHFDKKSKADVINIDKIMSISNFINSIDLTLINNIHVFIKYINNPSEEVQLKAVKRDGCSIQYIKNPSEEVQLEAVKQAGRSVIYIYELGIEPSETVQIAAVKQFDYNITYINKPSEAVQLAMVQQDPYSIKHLYNLGIKPSEAVHALGHKF